MSRLFQIPVIVLSLLPLLVVGRAAHSAESASHWRCILENDEFHHVRCERQDTQRLRVALADAVLRGGAWERMLDFVDEHDPALSTLATSPTETARAWRIPLYTIPFDTQGVVRLVRAALCRSEPVCRVTIEPSGSRY